MKRFWIVLLAMGLIAGFSTTGFAVDVKIGGEYYAAGMYLDRTSFKKDVGPSTAFYFQRLRVKTDFAVAPGLTLVTRLDAMERAWGATRTAPSTVLDADSAATRAENENIAIDWVYLDYKSPIGTFDVGYMNDGATGTIFGNSTAPAPRIKYSRAFGPATLNLAYTKVVEKSTLSGVAGYADADNDKYGIEGVYTWKDGKAGLNVNYYNYAANRPAATYNRSKYFLITPYAVAKIGPVALQAELNYAVGKQTYEEPSTTADRDLQGISGWVDATADFGKFYAGASLAYVSGDDPGTADKNEGQTVSGGRDWNPCLILFNNDLNYWAGAQAGWGATTNANAMTNAYFGQLRGGVRLIDKLDIGASVSYAHADKTLAGATWEGRDYGYEVDVTGTYKITNNLSYMLGAGYFFVGKWYKATTAVNQDVSNDYLVINKLTLTF